jgi:hypothetical protein
MSVYLCMYIYRIEQYYTQEALQVLEGGIWATIEGQDMLLKKSFESLVNIVKDKQTINYQIIRILWRP